MSEQDRQPRSMETVVPHTTTPTELQPPVFDFIPQQIGPYHVLDIIGEGGMGSVYKAEQREPIKRIVAIKVIKPGADSRQIIGRFESERQALARMDHPNIARVLDAGMTANHRPYFVMGFVPGVPVTQFCDDNHLRVRERLTVFIEVCKAIAHAHTKALIHRDIKARNVLAFMHDGKPAIKVIDFGIAKAMTGDRLTEQTFNTSRGEVVGTYDSMSPEQVEGSPDIDTRTDIYSLGVLLYELLAGAKPFDRSTFAQATDEEIKRIVREVEPPLPSSKLTQLGDEATHVAQTRSTQPRALANELRKELEWIPMMALRKERQRRYESVQQLQQDVENYLNGEALIAGPESRIYRLRKTLRKHRGEVTAAAVIVASLIAGIAATSWQAVRAKRAEQVAKRAETVAREHEIEALQQAAIAQAVNKFQLDMLRAADPDKMLGERVLVLDAARAAVKRLDEGELKDQPLVEAAVRDTIGDTLRALSRYDQAEPQLRTALDLRRKHLPANHPDIAASLMQLANLMQERGSLSESERLFREALDIRRASLPNDHPDIAQSLNALGWLLMQSGKIDQVQPLFEQALAIRRKALPADHRDIAQSLNNLTSLLHATGKHDDAEGLLREALASYRRALPAGHPMIAEALVNLAVTLQDRGKPNDAAPLLREALDIRRRALPAAHTETAKSMAQLSKLLRNQGKLDEAILLAREGLDMRRRLFKSDHMDVAMSLVDLGTMFLDREDLAAAEPLLREALDMQKRLQSPDQRMLAATQANLALVLFARRRGAEAEQLLSQALEIRRKVLAPTDPVLVANINDLATIRSRLNKAAEAETLFAEVLEVRRQTLSSDDLLLAQSMYNLGSVLRHQQKFAEAEPLLRDALRIREARLGATDPNTLRTAENLALVLTGLGKAAEAESIRRQYPSSQPASQPQP